ncbi:MAG: accessory factor UbiK family protein [Parvibaculales bacterium]|jgi:BMFP domain-containing protein YqiC
MNDTRAKIVDDLTSVFNGLGIAAQGVREEIEQAIGARIDRMISQGSFVTREEFELVRDMAIKAREENLALREALDALTKKK